MDLIASSTLPTPGFRSRATRGQKLQHISQSEIKAKKAAVKFLSSNVFRETLSSDVRKKLFRGESLWKEPHSDVLSVFRDLILQDGKKPGNSKGMKRVASGVYQAMQLEEFHDLPKSARKEIKRWHGATAGSVKVVRIGSESTNQAEINPVKIDFRDSNCETRSLAMKAFGLDEFGARTVATLSDVYGDEIPGVQLARAVADLPKLANQSAGWLADGIRKTIHNRLTSSKSCREKASAISFKMSWFMTECSEKFEALEAEDREIILDIHKRTGARDWEYTDRNFGDRVDNNSDFLSEAGVTFVELTGELRNQKLTSKLKAKLIFDCCPDNADERSIESLSTSIKSGKLSCKDCVVATGALENRFIGVAEAACYRTAGSTVQTQARIPGHQNKPFDLLVTSSQGFRTFFEIDGDQHYAPWSNGSSKASLSKFESKKLVDKNKVEAVAASGDSLVRVDARYVGSKLRGEYLELIWQAAEGLINPGSYIVVGKEAPGAESASKVGFNSVIAID